MPLATSVGESIFVEEMNARIIAVLIANHYYINIPRRPIYSALVWVGNEAYARLRMVQ